MPADSIQPKRQETAEAARAAPPPPASLPSRRPLSYHFALTVYWLSNALLWGALLHLGLQSRLCDWLGQERVGYYLGFLGAVGGIIGAAAQLVAGAYSDCCTHRLGRRKPFVISGVLLSCGALLGLGAAQSFWPFAAALCALQLFSNIASGPYAALLPDTIHPQEHGKASGLMGVARLIGDVGGLILAGFLLSTASLGENPSLAQLQAFHAPRFFLLCVIMAAFLLLTMLICVLSIPEIPLAQRPPLSPLQIVRRSFEMDVRAHPDFFWLVLSRGVTNLGFYIFLQTIFFFLKFSLQAPDPERLSMLIMLPAIAMAIASSIPAGLLSDRQGRKPLIYVSLVLMTLVGSGFAFVSRLRWIYVLALPAGLAYGIFTTVEWALACNLLPAARAAQYMGLWNASAVVPQIVAFPLAGAIGSAISARVPGLGWRVDFGITILCCLGGIGLLRYVRERQPGSVSSRQETAPPAHGRPSSADLDIYPEESEAAR